MTFLQLQELLLTHTLTPPTHELLVSYPLPGSLSLGILVTRSVWCVRDFHLLQLELLVSHYLNTRTPYLHIPPFSQNHLDQLSSWFCLMFVCLVEHNLSDNHRQNTWEPVSCNKITDPTHDTTRFGTGKLGR